MALKYKVEGNMLSKASHELVIAGALNPESDYGGQVGRDVLQLLEVFVEQGHSGGSSLLVVDAFSKLASWGNITPIRNPMLTGEYTDMSRFEGAPARTILKSTRKSSLFSRDGGVTWFDVNGPKRPWWWMRWLRGEYRAYVSFPLA